MIPVDPAAFTMAASVTNTLSFLHHSHPGSVFYLLLVLYFLIFITQKTRGHSEDIKGVWQLIRTFSFYINFWFAVTSFQMLGSLFAPWSSPLSFCNLKSFIYILFMSFTISVHCWRARGSYRGQRLVSASLLVTIRILKCLWCPGSYLFLKYRERPLGDFNDL